MALLLILTLAISCLPLGAVTAFAAEIEDPQIPESDASIPEETEAVTEPQTEPPTEAEAPEETTDSTEATESATGPATISLFLLAPADFLNRWLYSTRGEM